MGGYISILVNCLRSWGLREVVDTGNSHLWKTELMIFYGVYGGDPFASVLSLKIQEMDH